MNDLTHLVSQLVDMERQIFQYDRANADDFRRWLRKGCVFFTPECCLVMDFDSPFFARIESIGVLPKHRDKGYGKKLLDIANVWSTLRGYRNIRLEVRMTDINVNRFYNKNGYVYIDFIRSFYADGSNATVLGRSI